MLLLYYNQAMKHRVNIIFFLLLCTAAGFGVSRISFSGSMKIGSSFSIIIFALPAIVALYKWLGLTRALILFIVLSLLAYLFESVSIITGYPYGLFTYNNSMAYKLLDIVPWNVPFAWIPSLIGCVALAKRYSSSFVKQLIIASLLLVLFDLLLDPAAVKLGFWTWQNPGWYYQIPVTNYFGWVFSGAIGSAAVLSFGKKLDEVPVSAVLGFLSILFFWTAAAISLSLVIPVLVGINLIIVTGRNYLSNTSTNNRNN